MKSAYVRLLNEGTEVFRPIEVEELRDGEYRIIAPTDAIDEQWEFELGAVVTLATVATVAGEAIEVAAPR